MPQMTIADASWVVLVLVNGAVALMVVVDIALAVVVHHALAAVVTVDVDVEHSESFIR